ncbi:MULTISPECIES: hypothetical protein [Cytobacillus]|uniref:Uncharacterized protein n=2 Tax=Bacillati TaxID=1783272 RepID=A0A2N0ZBH0_9BACI|nr:MULTISPECIES: hypothetical protein [Cytobacillus]MDK7667328.1 hypothetical protein [Cytobacillus oceanisediminis]MEC1158663.1 hypothetical protein [Cytobacillus horneckiae]PKG26824.1 hypothetical protein CWS20_22020 [Cytobacillus horneckiae]
MTRGFELYQTWMNWLRELPNLNEDPQNGLIARAIILTNGALDEVEFITGASKPDIFQVYQSVTEKGLLHSLISGEKEIQNLDEMEMEDMTTATNKQRKVRTFTRGEMVDYLKRKLLEANPGIQFVGLKHNVLTCQHNGETFKVYISTSRDYESMRKAPEFNAYRVSAWNKGNHEIFSSCDYYAMLVKADTSTKYVTDSEEGIEGLFMSQEELSQWFAKKVEVPSGMINCYVHFIQKPGEGRSSTVVIDDREQPVISLNDLYQKGYTIR